MQSERISALLEQLTPEQRIDYERLLALLSDHGGDLSQLSEHEQHTLAQLSAAVNPQQSAELNAKVIDEDHEHTAEIPQAEQTIVPGSVPELTPSATPFGLYVVEQLKVLCEGGSSLADAVRYAYHNKYLPVSLRDITVCRQIYQRHQLEIDDLTASMQDVTKEQQPEKHVLVGLAWFSLLYQCYQYVEAYGDLH